MVRLDKWLENKVITNILVWVLLYALLILIIQSDNVVRDALLIIFIIMPSVYINNLFIIPLFYQNKKIIAFFFWIINLLAFTVLVVFVLTNVFSDFEWRMLYNAFGICTIILCFSSTLKVARDNSQRRQESIDSELKLLKAQLNPHFLFNTFNNLYGLSVKKSDKLPGLMLKLSELLRYSLYETKSTFVPLEKEVQYLESYVGLERIRIEDRAKITFNTDIDSEVEIPPMLLIVFVENAFKHLGSENNQNEIIDITINTAADSLHFICKNSFGKTENVKSKDSSGIGLDNVKKRLKLLYPNNHTLKVWKDENYFNIELKMKNR